MADNLEKLRHMEEVKLSYLRNRGNLLAIAKETNLSFDYVKKLVDKFKKSEERDVFAAAISSKLMEHIMRGYESRVVNLMEMLKLLRDRHLNTVSVCCEVPVQTRQDGVTVCLKCGLEKGTKVVDRSVILELELKCLQQLREEDTALADMAEKLGYSNKDPQPVQPVNNIRQNFVVVGGNKNAGKVDGLITQKVEQLHPLATEQLIKEIERSIQSELSDNQEGIK